MAPPSSDIALVISDLGSGGAQRVLVQLAKAWSQSGRRVTVITLADCEGDFFYLSPGVRRITISAIGSSRSLWGGLWANLVRVRRLREALREAQAPLAIVFIMPTAVLTLLASLRLPMRVIVCERNDPRRQSFGRIWELLRRLTYRWADLVTANSHGALDALKVYVPGDKLRYVSNPMPNAPQGAAALVDSPIILSIGRLNHQKAHDVLLKAFSIFIAKHCEWRLAIMGEGSEETKLRALASHLGIADRVDWPGTRPDPFPWLRAARIFSLASRYEGTPNALLEAMSCGIPCIVSDASPGPLELIEDGVSGLVVPVDDCSALAAAMDRLADDTMLSSRLGEAARARVQSHAPRFAMLSWEAAIAAAMGGQ